MLRRPHLQLRRYLRVRELLLLLVLQLLKIKFVVVSEFVLLLVLLLLHRLAATDASRVASLYCCCRHRPSTQLGASDVPPNHAHVRRLSIHVQEVFICLVLISLAQQRAAHGAASVADGVYAAEQGAVVLHLQLLAVVQGF